MIASFCPESLIIGKGATKRSLGYLRFKCGTNEVDVTEIQRPGCRQLYLNRLASPKERAYETAQKLFDSARFQNAHLLGGVVFGSERMGAGGNETHMSTNWPMYYFDTSLSPHRGVTGAQAWAVADCDVLPLWRHGRILGGCYEDADARFCFLGGLVPSDPLKSRMDQLVEVLETAEQVLGEVGMNFSHVARTWFYLDRILDWYDEFNQVRNRFFEPRDIFEGVLPASTGIGVSNELGLALSAQLIAIAPKKDGGRVFAVPSPMQCSPLRYKSAFSRAVEVELRSHRQLYVSGVASIDGDGKTARPGDMPAQIELTLDVIEALLKSRRMDWSNATRAVAYMTDREAFGSVEASLIRRGAIGLLWIPAISQICRGDLLFEMEVDAVAVA
jgi:enamine deaminase RidA (YjgF/YER057c/UK114 family)